MFCCWYFCLLSSVFELSETWLSVGFLLGAQKPSTCSDSGLQAKEAVYHLACMPWPCVQKVYALKHILLAFIANLTHQRGKPEEPDMKSA